jgi:hypothetical protein
MLVAYVSGKYRDPRGPWYVVQNIREAEAVAMELWQMGIAVICPHKNTALFEGPLDDPIIIAGDIELVKRSDIVVMIPNWTTSVGSKMEMTAGVSADKPIFFWPNDRLLVEAMQKPQSKELQDELAARRIQHSKLITEFGDLKV